MVEIQERISDLEKRMDEFEDQDNAKIGYQAAINLWGILVETSWSRINAMVVANSIIIGMLVLSSQPVPTFFAKILSVIGVILTILWALMMHCDAKFVDYYRQ